MAIARWYPSGSGTRPLVSGSAWDVLTFAGEPLPGRTKITQASVAWKVDEKRAAGKDADRPTKYGFESRPFVFEVEVVSVEEMEAVNRILAPYTPRPGANMDPVTVDHPAIHHMVGFFAVTVREVPHWEGDGPRRRLRVTCATWVASEKPPAKGASTKVQTPTRAIKNKQQEEAKKRGTAGGMNPAPNTQSTYCGPSFSVQP